MASACINNFGVSQEFPAYGSAGSEMQKEMPKVAAVEAVGASDT